MLESVQLLLRLKIGRLAFNGEFQPGLGLCDAAHRGAAHAQLSGYLGVAFPFVGGSVSDQFPEGIVAMGGLEE